MISTKKDSEHEFEKLVKDYCRNEGKDTALCHLFKSAPDMMEVYQRQEKMRYDLNKTSILSREKPKKPCTSCLGSKPNSTSAVSDPCDPCNNNPANCARKIFAIVEENKPLFPLTDHDVQLLLNQLALPVFPQGLFSTNLETFVLGLANRIVAYQYLPILLIVIIMIWLMVAVSWITIATGLILTIVFIAIMYFFFVSFRVSVKAFVDSFISTLTSSVQDYRAGVTNAIKRIPTTIGIALCMLAGTTYNPGKPTCPTACGSIAP
jgi:hypothetical protein